MSATFIASTDTFIARLRGWRGKLCCFLAGALLAGVFAPFYVWPLLFVAFPFLFLMLDKARHWRSAALYSWAFGYGHMMAGTYWIANALAVDTEQFGWLIPISILGLSLVMAIWFALFGALYRALRTGHLGTDIVYFAVLWVLVEYLRSLGMFGFPWNLLGAASMASLPFAQILSLVGPYGAGFLLVLGGLVPVLWLKQHAMRHVALWAAALSLAVVYGWGVSRLPEKAPTSDMTVRIVQGNIPQSLKWTAEGRASAAHVYGELTRQPSRRTPSIVVWPETAIPYTLRGEMHEVASLGELLPNGTLLVTGAVRAIHGPQDDYQLYNSIVAVDSSGTLRDAYNKHQLVPFGEFVPLRALLPLEKITAGNVDFSRGEGMQRIAIGPYPSYRPLVCYEVIFPAFSRQGARPEWIVNATNDAWYGMSPGPFQHYDMARMRAVEQGLPLVRAANTGISAIIDPYGRAVAHLPLNQRGVVDHALPLSLTPTPYARWGESVTFLLLILGILLTRCSHFCAKK